MSNHQDSALENSLIVKSVFELLEKTSDHILY